MKFQHYGQRTIAQIAARANARQNRKVSRKSLPIIYWLCRGHTCTAQGANTVDFGRIAREGFIAGVIGAASVAIWFLIVDTIAGKPFFTPAMLGSAVFWGESDPAEVVIAFPRIVGYTMFHVIAFLVVGMLAALLTYEIELFPTTLFLGVVAFAVFEVGFYVVVAVLAAPLLGALAWYNVAVGNAIAAGGMGYYLWRAHPKLREELREHPLGDTWDD